jgi:mono/diheme cytochrome c family protein
MRYDGGTMRRLGSALTFAVVMLASAFVQSTKSVWSGVYTSEQAKRGGDLYQSKCAECHGDDLEGRERAPALAGGTFGQRWDGATLKKLFERMEEMPPDDPKARLAAKQYVDILAYLLSANNIPAGTAALVADKDALALIKYTSRRPGLLDPASQADLKGPPYVR